MGKSSKPTIGYWYRVAYHHGLTVGPIDAFLEFRGGDKTAWQGELTASGTISVDAPNLWGGEKDQGGIVGDLTVMFGEDTQVPNPYLVSVFGNQTAAWRGFTTVAFQGGRYGAMNPYPQPASYKIRRILQGWDGGAAWYPDKAPITLVPDTPVSGSVAYTDVWKYRVEAPGSGADYSASSYDDSGWSTGPGGFGSAFTGATVGTSITPEVGKAIWLRRQLDIAIQTPVVVSVSSDDGAWVYWNGVLKFQSGGYGNWSVTIPAEEVLAHNVLAVKVMDSVPTGGPSNIFAGVGVTWDGLVSGLRAMNPAHILYESRTNGDMGRESTGNINDASLRAAADKLYAEGFGICPKRDPASESVEAFEQRIARLIGGSFSRSLEDGQWYLDLARGDYVLNDLPILTDDDILDFKEQPSAFDSATNSVSVRYFDPERKETIVTPPVRALGLVTTFGTIHQTYDFPEIPTADLATRVALRELLATTTPTRAFDLVTTRRTYAWRPGQYFRLQAPKRGIADMVCLVGEKESGTLKSGAIKLKAAQDIYGLPSTSFVQVEPGVDPQPDQRPNAITLQRVLEAPYVEVAPALGASELSALAADAGFAMAIAAAPAGEVDFTMMVSPSGGAYDAVGHGEWCATATVIAAAAKTDTAFTLDNAARLAQVTVGMGALWDDEIVRVDAIDVGAGTITLARGCADTVPVAHAAGSRLWFYEVGFAFDSTEFTDGESISVKLLSNTGSQQLPLGSAMPLGLTFAQRQSRPYAPGNVQVDGSAWPATVSGSFDVSWAHRDRVQQADMLVDTTTASIGPESTARYGLRFEDATTAALIVERTDLGGPDATVQLGASAPASVRMKLWAISDAGDSWQTHEHVFSFSGGSGAPSVDGVDYIPPPDATIVDGNDPPPTSSGSGSTLDPGGAGTPGTPPTLTIGATVIDPCASPYNASPSASAATNSTAFNSAFAALPAGGGTVRPSIAGAYQIDTSNSITPVSQSRLDLVNAILQAAFSSTVTSPSVHRNVLHISGVHDVEIINGKIIGYRDAWAANGGVAAFGKSEWAHGAGVGNATNVNFVNLSIEKCVGDGISIGATASYVYIGNFKTANNRRQGISNGGDNVTVEDFDIGYIGGSDGTSPMAGIDNEVDLPDVNSSTNMVIRRGRIHHCTGPGIQFYKNCNNATVEDVVCEYNAKGIYAYNSANVTVQGSTKLRYNKYEGMHLAGASTGWNVRADFFDNKTKQYGAPSGGTTTAPSDVLKAKNVTVASTATGLIYDPTTTWGAA